MISAEKLKEKLSQICQTAISELQAAQNDQSDPNYKKMLTAVTSSLVAEVMKFIKDNKLPITVANRSA